MELLPIVWRLVLLPATGRPSLGPAFPFCQSPAQITSLTTEPGNLDHTLFAVASKTKRLSFSIASRFRSGYDLCHPRRVILRTRRGCAVDWVGRKRMMDFDRCIFILYSFYSCIFGVSLTLVYHGVVPIGGSCSVSRSAPVESCASSPADYPQGRGGDCQTGIRT